MTTILSPSQCPPFGVKIKNCAIEIFATFEREKIETNNECTFLCNHECAFMSFL